MYYNGFQFHRLEEAARLVGHTTTILVSYVEQQIFEIVSTTANDLSFYLTKRTPRGP